MDNSIVSIVIPIYNKEKYIAECLDSIIGQTCGLKAIEVLCINDGSTDGSRYVVEKYAKKYSCIQLIDQENQGVSAARNTGLANATGKYILFLDPDDMLSENSVADIVTFFDTNYDKIDIVTYSIFYYNDKTKKMERHKRGANFKNNCIISIKEYPDFSQTTINICIKNEKNIFFRKDLFLCEDQFFSTELIFRKKTLGFCTTAKYIYRRNIGGISELQHPYYTFNYFILFHESLFEIAGKDADKVKYVENLFLYSLSWRIKQNMLYPYHFDDEKYQHACEKLYSLLDRIDNRTILNNQWLIDVHKYYLLGLKRKNRAFPIFENNRWWLCDTYGDLSVGKNITLVIERERIKGNTLTLMGFLKSVIFSFTEKPLLWMHIQGKRQLIPLYESANSMFNSKIKTNNFWGFELKHNIEPMDKITFSVEIEGKSYEVVYWFRDWNNMNTVTKNFIHFSNPISMEYSSGALICHAYSDIKQRHKKALASLRRKSFGRYCLRIIAGNLKKIPIWLYSDYTNVFDNSYIQFRHDLKKKDGILRCYVYSGNKKELKKHLNWWERLHTVRFKSLLHRLLFISSQKILTSYAGISQFVPYTKAFRYYSDIINFETIYLQHGVMHALCDDLYAKDRSPFIDRIVASTYFEVTHFSNALHFQKNDIIATGMPRLTHLGTKNPQKKHAVLFAPSWRYYLVKHNNDGWGASENFVGSDFYKNIMAFLNHPSLIKLLQKHDVRLDIKLHPNFHMYKDFFKSFSNFILLKDTIKPNDYDCLITDFSSYQFDFLYLNIPVIHFFPDGPQVRAGLHTYREFIHPLGNNAAVTSHPNELLSELDIALSTQYLENSDLAKTLFLPHKEDICEDIYRHIMRLED